MSVGVRLKLPGLFHRSELEEGLELDGELDLVLEPAGQDRAGRELVAIYYSPRTPAGVIDRERDTEPSMGELRAEWRENHLCLRCRHHAICKMAGALDPSFVVVISQCLAFESVS